jgi:hypothetical protein
MTLGHRAHYRPGVDVAHPSGGECSVRGRADHGYRLGGGSRFRPPLPAGVPGSGRGQRGNPSTVLLDTTMACTVLVITPALAWPIALAVVLSTARSGFALQNLRHVLAG